jgi:hypothetical protein
VVLPEDFATWLKTKSSFTAYYHSIAQYSRQRLAQERLTVLPFDIRKSNSVKESEGKLLFIGLTMQSGKRFPSSISHRHLMPPTYLAVHMWQLMQAGDR